MLRTGIGYDLHKLKRGRKLILGGVHIPFKKGEQAHSDGDALIHAIIDSLLGASGAGDIGEFFPSEDKKWKNAKSTELLKIIWTKLSQDGWTIENIDCVIIIQKPKVLPYRKEICENICNILGIKKNQFFIKAKTGEKIGIVGRGKAIAVLATALISCQNTQE